MPTPGKSWRRAGGEHSGVNVSLFENQNHSDASSFAALTHDNNGNIMTSSSDGRINWQAVIDVGRY